MRNTGAWFRETLQIASVGGDGGSGSPNDAGDAGTVGAPDATASQPSATAFSDISETDQTPTTTTSGSVLLQGSSLTLVYDCPSGQTPFATTYTADPSQLILFIPDQGAGVGQVTYRKQ
jgi:hypothetical protein